MQKYKTEYHFVGEWTSEIQKEQAKKMHRSIGVLISEMIDPHRTYIMRRFKDEHPGVSLKSSEFRMYKVKHYNTIISTLSKWIVGLEEDLGLLKLTPLYDYKFGQTDLTITNEHMGQMYVTYKKVEEE